MADRTFRITLHDGRIFDVNADHEPNEQEVMDAIKNQNLQPITPDKSLEPPAPAKQPSDVSLSIGSVVQKALEPTIKLTPEMQKALEYETQPSVTESFSDKMARYGENLGRFGLNSMLGLSSPASLGLGALTFGSSAAETAGLPNLARGLQVPGRLASAGMAGKGLYDVGQGNVIPGAMETGLGILGMKSNLGPVGTTLEQAGATVPPNVPSTTVVAEPTLASSKLMQALEDSNIGKVKGDWEAQLAQERAKRFATAEAVKTTGMAGLEEMKGAMSGAMNKPGFTPIQLTQVDVDQLANEILGNTSLSTPEKIRAGIALNKVLSGQLPQNNEIDLLGRVWGRQFSQKLMEARPWTRKGFGLIGQAVDATKSLVTAGHFSAPFRNAALMVHRPEFWSSFQEMFQAFGSEENAARISAATKTLPDYELMKNVGLSITDLTEPLSTREDLIRSRITEKIPLYGKYWIKPGNRAYMTYLNTIRASVMQDLINDYASIAEKLEDPKLRLEANPRTNLVFAKQLADYVNAATGRGSLGTFEKYSNELNTFFMSPRMQAARIQMFKTLVSPNTLPQVRKEALKSAAALMAAGLSINGLARFGGGQVNGEPTSADFGKAKIGETRVDPWAGNQQYIVAMARQTPYIGGGTTSTRTGKFTQFGKKFGSPTRLDSISDFVANHASPPVKVAYDLLNARGLRGGQSTFDMGKEAAGMTMPIVAQQVYELSKENPQLLPLVIPGSFGMGIQTYSPR